MNQKLTTSIEKLMMITANNNNQLIRCLIGLLTDKEMQVRFITIHIQPDLSLFCLFLAVIMVYDGLLMR